MGVGGQSHAPAALPQGKTGYPLCRRLGWPQDRSGLVRLLYMTLIMLIINKNFFFTEVHVYESCMSLSLEAACVGSALIRLHGVKGQNTTIYTRKLVNIKCCIWSEISVPPFEITVKSLEVPIALNVTHM
jgi:hypothetical protein